MLQFHCSNIGFMPTKRAVRNHEDPDRRNKEARAKKRQTATRRTRENTRNGEMGEMCVEQNVKYGS